jgi:c-di-GMP-binding flagellar brake protein YcgR
MDKRQYYRFNINLEVRYRTLESLRPYKITSSEDMSEKGIKINLPEYIAPDTRLELIVKLRGETAPIMVIGRVVWTKKDVGARLFTTGIDLVYIREEDKQRFYQKAFL